MMRGFCLIFYFIVGLAIPIHSLPKNRFTRDGIKDENVVGVATNIITSAVLKSLVESDSNHVFSPFGFSSILAILNEGTNGKTFDEVNDVLRHPSEREIVRKAYNEILGRMQGHDPHNDPQFKTWFYVYRNNTIETEFRKTLVDSYLVEVRDIDRTSYDFDDPKTSVSIYDEEQEIADNTKPVPDLEASTFRNIETEKKEETTGYGDNQEDTKAKIKVDEDKNPKFDKNIDDKEYVEVVKIKEEIAKQKENSANEVLDEDLMQIKFIEKLEQKLDELIDNKRDEPEKISLSLKKFDDEEHEIMHAVESKAPKGRQLQVPRGFLTGDIASALSGNSLVGQKPESDEGSKDPEQFESKMLLFNGLYYRGSWAIPFQQLRQEENSFYTFTDDKPVLMMRARGTYRLGYEEMLDANVIELPYNNSRYALLLVVPSTKDGLKDVIKQFDSETIERLSSKLKETQTNILIPKFRVDTTSRAEKALAKLGMTSVFTTKADFSGIAKDQSVHVDELVQHVSIRVDEGASSENSISGTIAHGSQLKSDLSGDNSQLRSDTEEEFIADKPFLFFVRDVVDKIVIVAGKITDVPALDDFPK